MTTLAAPETRPPLVRALGVCTHTAQPFSKRNHQNICATTTTKLQFLVTVYIHIYINDSDRCGRRRRAAVYVRPPQPSAIGEMRCPAMAACSASPIASSRMQWAQELWHAATVSCFPSLRGDSEQRGAGRGAGRRTARHGTWRGLPPHDAGHGRGFPPGGRVVLHRSRRAARPCCVAVGRVVASSDPTRPHRRAFERRGR